MPKKRSGSHVCRDCHEAPEKKWLTTKAWRDTQRCQLCFESAQTHRAGRRRSRMMDDRSVQDLYDAGVL